MPAPDPHRPLVAVLLRTESFSRIWEGLGRDAGVSVALGATLEELAPVSGAAALLVVVAGREEDAMEEVRLAAGAGAPGVAVVGAAADHRVAVAAMAAGARNYFALPADLEVLRAWLADLAERGARAARAAEMLRREQQRYDFSRIVGRSAGLRAALDRVSRVIPRDAVTVLVTGETGTGKELLAEAIHYNGPRAAQPFVAINCAALPENLLEAELFGYEKGAFTDARAAKPGLFEAAHRGTLFLDEIGELGPALQAKLLRALEDRRIRRLGSVRSVEVDVRIIAATHARLEERVAEGLFRRDLFYRLNVLRAELPPLRERGEDVVLLAEAFLDRFCHDYALPRPPITAGVRHALLSHPWPGNVRELRNAVERALLMGDGGLRVEDLLDGPRGAPAADGAIPFPATMDEIEHSAAAAMLERCGGNKTAAADALAISRTRLYRLLGEAAT